MRATTPFQLRGIALNPSVNGSMIDLQPTLPHHFFEVPIAERIAQIPSDAQEDDVGLKMTPFEGRLLTHKGILLCSFLSTLADQLPSCNTTGMRGVWQGKLPGTAI